MTDRNVTEADGGDDDARIAEYRARVLAEAELDADELDEIEDHMRELAADLREHGVARAEAIALACQRLGDPRDVAREHARSRSRFGSRLSRVRAWGATALLAVPLVAFGPNSFRWGAFTFASLQIALWVVAVIGLAARRAWARALVLGTVATSLTIQLIDLVAAPLVAALRDTPAEFFAGGHAATHIALIATNAAAFALVCPMRRGELARRGLALALLVPAYLVALETLVFFVASPTSSIVADPIGALALALDAVAMIGVTRGARWASTAAFAVSFALAALAIHAAVGMYRTRFDATSLHVHLATSVALGGCGALASALLLHRARSERFRSHGVIGQ